MKKFPIGLTLTPEEKALVMAPASDQTTANRHHKIVRSHVCDVELPNGARCTVTYTRFSPHSHQFLFAEPIKEQIWVDSLKGWGIAAIEQKARDLVQQAFQGAQHGEQKAMRRRRGAKRIIPNGTSLNPGPDMDARSAERLSGKYAVCCRFQSGRLIRIGPVHEKPEDASQEIQSGRHASTRLLNG